MENKKQKCTISFTGSLSFLVVANICLFVATWTVGLSHETTPFEHTFSYMLATYPDMLNIYFLWLGVYILTCIVFGWIVFSDDIYLFHSDPNRVHKYICRSHTVHRGLYIACVALYILFTFFKLEGLIAIPIYPTTTEPSKHMMWACLTFVSAIGCAVVLFIRRFLSKNYVLLKYSRIVIFINFIEVVALITSAILFVALDVAAFEFVLTLLVCMDICFQVWDYTLDSASVTLEERRRIEGRMMPRKIEVSYVKNEFKEWELHYEKAEAVKDSEKYLVKLPPLITKF